MKHLPLERSLGILDAFCFLLLVGLGFGCVGGAVRKVESVPGSTAGERKSHQVKLVV